jgi:hypothetical protein
MLLVGIGSKIMGSVIKSITNKNKIVEIVLESGIIFTQSEIEDYVANQKV